MEFKDKLKSLRKERGLSQQALADAIFISRRAVAKWENGLGLPSDESMNALLNYFDVPREYFATDEPEKVLMKKNQLIRRMAFALTLSVTILSTVLVSLFAMLLVSVPVVNCLTAAEKTSVPQNSEVTLIFIYGEEDILVTLEDDEAEKVIDILNENNYAPLLSGVPSCGFDKNISLKIGGRSFAIACDTCNCIQDLGNLRYFDIPEEDMEYIHSLFEKYGGYFPCV